MRIVGERTDVPVPTVRWIEPTGEVLGTPFFLMDRIDGVVPPDVLPYNFGDNWLSDASREDQRRLQDSTVEALAGLHAIPDAGDTFAFLDRPAHAGRDRRWRATSRGSAPGTSARSRTSAGRRSSSARSPGSRPTCPTRGADTVLCWGDSRIGNVMYRDFEPVGVLDWEMAAIGPREMDLSWIVFAHMVFESITAVFEMPGMPHFLREEDVKATYDRAHRRRARRPRPGTTSTTRVQWCIVFMRTGARQIHFGEIERPDDIETCSTTSR